MRQRIRFLKTQSLGRIFWWRWWRRLRCINRFKKPDFIVQLHNIKFAGKGLGLRVLYNVSKFKTIHFLQWARAPVIPYVVAIVGTDPIGHWKFIKGQSVIRGDVLFKIFDAAPSLQVTDD